MTETHSCTRCGASWNVSFGAPPKGKDEAVQHVQSGLCSRAYLALKVAVQRYRDVRAVAMDMAPSLDRRRRCEAEGSVGEMSIYQNCGAANYNWMTMEKPALSRPAFFPSQGLRPGQRK